jgi:hypothetical protein
MVLPGSHHGTHYRRLRAEPLVVAVSLIPKMKYVRERIGLRAYVVKLITYDDEIRIRQLEPDGRSPHCSNRLSTAISFFQRRLDNFFISL